MSKDINEKWEESWKSPCISPSPDLCKDIRDFHEKFGLEYNGPPQELNLDLFSFRVGFLNEELNEYVAAENGMCYAADLAKQLDALVDLVYVALGTAYLQGFDFNEAWRRVHAANLQKVRATSTEQSKRGSDHDVVKPEGWQAPDLLDLVK